MLWFKTFISGWPQMKSLSKFPVKPSSLNQVLTQRLEPRSCREGLKTLSRTHFLTSSSHVNVVAKSRIWTWAVIATASPPAGASASNTAAETELKMCFPSATRELDHLLRVLLSLALGKEVLHKMYWKDPSAFQGFKLLQKLERLGPHCLAAYETKY